MKSGFIAIIGRPNAGKSSLLNTLVGEKVAIVSPKSQTTRNKINGILTTDAYQLVFTDTPGVHRPKNKLSDYMLKSVTAATEDTDAVIVVIDGEKGVTDADITLIGKYDRYPLIVAYNKIDLIGFDRAYPEIEKLNSLPGLRAIVPLSARTGQNKEKLLEELLKFIPEGVRYYPDDEYTDKNIRFIVAEIVREKALLNLGDEIPHGIGVVIAALEDTESRCDIAADIVCEKATHKPIIIGKGGASIKRIGEQSRRDIERLLNKRVRIELFVKVRDNWRDSTAYLNDIGYNKKDI